MTRVLITGGRDFKNRSVVSGFLSNFHDLKGIETLIHGGADGADHLAGQWAKYNEIDYEVYPAKWGTNGRSAGPIRNQHMLDKSKPDVVIAFPGGRGTADMVKRATKAGVQIIKIDE